MKKRTKQILVRLSENELKGFQMASELEGLPLGAWARKQLRRGSAAQLREADICAPFLEELGVSI